MKIIDRYVHDVVRRLPEKQRGDVAKELGAEIQDMIEDRAESGHTKKQVAYDVLVELGSPSQLADRYRERPRYVIGPEYYESYVFLLKTTYLVVLPLLGFIIFMSEVMTASHTALTLALKVAGVLFEAAIHIFFWTTLSFLLVQKIAAGQSYIDNWKPDDLPDLPPEQAISRGESFFAIAWSIFAVLATLYQVPFVYQLIGPDDVPQFFSPAMWPLWTLGLLAVSLLGLATEWIKMMAGGWTKLTVGLVAAVNSITICFFISVLVIVQPIANPAMMELITESFGRENIAQSVGFWIKIFVGVVVAISLWEIGEAMYKYKKGVRR